MPKNFEGAKKSILDRFKKELNPNYYYHSIEHTKNVYEVSKRIGELEKISDNEMILLKTAALYHDSGFIESYENHEEISAKIAKQLLPNFNYKSNEIEIITKMILSTKIPQAPENLLENIICDADLDYLGRDDYFEISDKLFLEWKYIGINLSKKEWKDKQIKFFENHNYFTKTSKELRKNKKKNNLLKLKNI